MVSMTVTVELSEESIARLEAESTRRGVSIEFLIDELTSRLPRQNRGGQKLSLIGLGASTSGRRASEADEMLAEGFGQS